MPDNMTRKQASLLRKGSLWNERASWVEHWRLISQYQQPRSGRFVVSDRNKGNRRHNLIYDNNSVAPARILASGMMSGMTSPARPWFRLALPDKDLMQHGPVKVWLHRTGELLREIFTSSNTYRALHMGYEELGLFGTWSDIVLSDFENVIHHYPLTVGEYAIGTDHRGVVDTVARELEMTVAQMVGQFGKDACSQTVRNLFDRGAYDSAVPVYQVIEPNKGRDLRKADNRNMRWSSIYFEPGNGAGDSELLSEGGYKRFPALCPRWVVRGQDVYGESPGMEALGDVQQLQHQQLRKGQGIDYMTNPPLQVPTAYKDAARSRLPGGIMYVDSATPGGGVRSAFEVNLNLQHLLLDIEDVRSRVRSAYYADMFLMLANDTRSGVTATEIAERHEEKLLMLGPVLERLHNELLSPMIDLAFDHAAEAGILPPPPPELQGMDLNIEFVSTLAQAQRAVSAQGLDRLLGTIGSISGLFPEAARKVNVMKLVDEYADLYGVNPEVIVPTDEAQAAAAQQAQAAQAAQMAAAAPGLAGAVKTMSDVNSEGLNDVMNRFSGYGTPSPALVQ